MQKTQKTTSEPYVIRSYTASPALVEQLREAAFRYRMPQAQIVRRAIERELVALAKENT